MSTDLPTSLPADESQAVLRAKPAGFAREWAIVFRHEFRRLLLTPRTLVPMVIYGGFACLWLWGFQNIEHQIEEKRDQMHMTDEEVATTSRQALSQGLTFTGWGNEGDAAEIERDHVPVTIVVFFALASYFLPLLVAVVSFDQFSELSTRGARFALLRVRRDTYVLGKAAAALGSVVAFLGLMWLIVIGALILHTSHEVTIVIREGIRAWVLMVVLALPYLSATALISAFVRPALAFVLTLGTWVSLSFGAWFVGHGGPWLLTKFGLSSLVDYEKDLLVLFPWQHASALISRDTLTLARGATGLLLLGIAGYVATMFVVRRRDV